MQINLKTIYSAAIATLALYVALKSAPAEAAIRNGAFVQHHRLHHSSVPLKDYGLPASEDAHLRYHCLAGGHPHPYHLHHHHHYPQLSQQSLHYAHSQQHEDALLRESAKDPKNLRNGILHNGALTYDLGLPRYEILNAHEPPEIITSDQPHYQTHLKQLQQAQNFTLEDFGATAAPQPQLQPQSQTQHPRTTEEPTTEEPQAEPETTTTAAHSEEITQSAVHSEHLQANVEREISNVKNKLKKFNEEIKKKVDKNAHNARPKERDVNFVVIRKDENLRKKLKPAPFKAATPHTADGEKDHEREPLEEVAIPSTGNVQQQSHFEERPPIQGGALGASNIQDLYMPIPGGAGKSTLSVYPYAESSNLYSNFPAQSPIRPMQYSGFNPHIGVQNPLNNFYNAPEEQLPMSVGNIHRLYRSASFLENSMKPIVPQH